MSSLRSGVINDYKQRVIDFMNTCSPMSWPHEIKETSRHSSFDDCYTGIRCNNHDTDACIWVCMHGSPDTSDCIFGRNEVNGADDTDGSCPKANMAAFGMQLWTIVARCELSLFDGVDQVEFSIGRKLNVCLICGYLDCKIRATVLDKAICSKPACLYTYDLFVRAAFYRWCLQRAICADIMGQISTNIVEIVLNHRAMCIVAREQDQPGAVRGSSG